MTRTDWFRMNYEVFKDAQDGQPCPCCSQKPYEECCKTWWLGLEKSAMELHDKAYECDKKECQGWEVASLCGVELECGQTGCLGWEMKQILEGKEHPEHEMVTCPCCEGKGKLAKIIADNLKRAVIIANIHGG